MGIRGDPVPEMIVYQQFLGRLCQNELMWSNRYLILIDYCTWTRVKAWASNYEYLQAFSIGLSRGTRGTHSNTAPEFFPETSYTIFLF